MSDISASEYISRQTDLEDEARTLMPWDPKKCTYEMGALRQQVFACRTHNIGICYSCSIQCHTMCDIVELFTKRHFTCDCGTERDALTNENKFKCQLRENTEPDIPSLENRYGHNFKGLFCSCNNEYDPDSNAVMLQCVLGTECNEDWYHDHCILGIDEAQREGKNKNSDELVAKGMPPLDSFDAYICWKCVSKYDYYFKKILSYPSSGDIIAHTIPHGSSHVVLPKENYKKRSILEITDVIHDHDEYSIFLKNGYSEELKKLKSSFHKNEERLYTFLNDLVPFLLDDDPVYEQPVDDNEDADDVMNQILQDTLQREQAIAGISAFNALKSRLSEFLKPFADTGQVVKEEDIKSFFEESKK